MGKLCCLHSELDVVHNNVEENIVLEYKRVVDYTGILGLGSDRSLYLGGVWGEASSWYKLLPQEEVTVALGK